MTVSTREDKRICFPVSSEEEYRQLIADCDYFRDYILQIASSYPEIFPPGIGKGFCFHDRVVSTKQQLPTRRIKLKSTQAVYQLRPDFVMPYMVEKTDEIDKPMYWLSEF